MIEINSFRAPDVRPHGSRYEIATRSCGLFAATLGAVVLAGWTLRFGFLRAPLRGYPAMMPDAAAMLVLGGSALFAAQLPGRRVRILRELCAGAMLLTGLLKLTEWTLGVDLQSAGLPLILAAVHAIFPGRMSPATACVVTLAGGSLLLTLRRWRLIVQQWLALAGASLSLIAAVCYLLGVHRLFGFAPEDSMAPHTAIGLGVLSVGLLLRHPHIGIVMPFASEDSGGVLARRLLPGAVLIPILVGWLRWEGQVYGFYGVAAGIALLIASNIAVFTFLIWKNAKFLNTADSHRRTAIDHLRESEAQFRQLADAMPQIVWTARPDGTADYFNKRGHDYFGIATEPFEWDRSSAIHPDDVDLWRSRWCDSVAKGAPYQIEYRLRRHSDGAYRWHLGRAAPIRNSAGEVTRWFGTSTEIEDFKQAEAGIRSANQALEERVAQATSQFRHSEERYRMLVENVRDFAILMLDVEGTVISWTAAAARVKGYTAEEIIGKSFELFYPPGEVKRGHPREVLRLARTTGHFEEEGWRVRKDGSQFWAHVVITAVYGSDGQLRGFSKITHDVSERRRAELRLEDREKQFRLLLDCAPDAIVIVDGNENLSLVNTQTEKLFGYGRGELIGYPVEKLLMADLKRLYLDFVLQNRREPKAPLADEGMELQGRRKNGELFPIEVRLSSIDTQEFWVAAGIRDITERKNSEEKLIAERRRAEAANRTKSEFLAVMSHEIRTPMNSILGMADLLSETELAAEQRQYVEVFQRAGATLLALIDNILDFSKIESGRLEFETVPFDLEDVVDQAVELVGSKARKKKLAVMSRLVPGVPTALVGDPTRLRQILINLLGNAVKFTAAGEVVVTLEGKVDGDLAQIAIAVSDTGIGISPDKAQTVFAEFTQADNTITREFGGSGLGLAISKRLVEGMGGQLTVSSQPGKGSTFRFTLPFRLGDQNLRKAERNMADLHGRRAMVIDDNPVNCLILGESLRAWGIEVATFQKPEAALQELASGDYSLVLMDKALPGSDGFSQGARIRAVAPEIPMILLSSDHAFGDSMRSAAAGFAGFAVKPVKRTDLFRMVCQALKAGPVQCEQLPEAAPLPPRAVAGPGISILIAEDSEDNRLLMEAYMNGAPHTITFAFDGEAAVEAFAKDKFDLVLMDLQMPRMDGLTATRKIRAMEAQAHSSPISIVALSANARVEDVDLSREAGCNGHWSKPISKGRLLAGVAEFAVRN